VVMITRGPKDEAKLRAVRAALGDRRPLLLFDASEVMDAEGRVSLEGVDLAMQKVGGLRLRGSLLILPEGMHYKVDVPDSVLRSILIATINDLLDGHLLRGPTLHNIHKIARLVAMSA
jgi:hypothetical protein